MAVLSFVAGMEATAGQPLVHVGLVTNGATVYGLSFNWLS
jgi:hypothetical protein